jgi:hypothetical protein
VVSAVDGLIEHDPGIAAVRVVTALGEDAEQMVSAEGDHVRPGGIKRFAAADGNRFKNHHFSIFQDGLNIHTVHKISPDRHAVNARKIAFTALF